MTSRPVALAAAIAGLAVIGASFGFAGAILLAVAAGALGPLVPASLATTAIAALGVTSLLTALVAGASAAGLWSGRSWAWPAALGVALIAGGGAVIAVATAGAQVPLLAGLGLTLGAAGLLLAPSTRSAAGIG